MSWVSDGMKAYQVLSDEGYEETRQHVQEIEAREKQTPADRAEEKAAAERESN
jgi:hypothetical protein